MRVAPYAVFAAVYDRWYARERGRPLAFFAPVLAEPLARATRVCDLACGTGLLAAAMARAGKRVVAVDRSRAMLAIARRRAARSRGRMRVVAGDMRRFRLDEPVDLVTCFFDSLNHLPRRADLAPAFRRVAAALQPGGEFVFDVNTPRGVRRIWPESPEEVKVGGVRAVVEGDRSGAVRIRWTRKGGARATELYREIGWTASEIRAALRAAGFRAIERFDGRVVEPKLGRGLRTYWRARR